MDLLSASWEQRFEYLSTLSTEGRYSEALAVAEALEELGLAEFGNFDDSSAGLLLAVGEAFRNAARIAEAEQRFLAALAILEGMANKELELLATLGHLSRFYASQNRGAEAIFHGQRGLDLRRLLGLDGDEEFLHHLEFLTLLYEVTGDFPSAEAGYLELMERAEALLGKDDLRTTDFLSQWADFLQKKGELAWAESQLKEVLERQRRIGDGRSAAVGRTLNYLGQLRIATCEPREARLLFEEALQILETQLPADDFWLLACRGNWGVALLKMGEYPQAEAVLVDFAERCRSLGEKGRAGLAQALSNLGLLYQGKGEYAAAERCGLEAVEVGSAVFGPEAPAASMARSNLALTYYLTGASGRALSLLSRSLEVQVTRLKEGHLELISGVNNLATFLEGNGESELAQAALERARELAVHHLPPDHPTQGSILENLARLLRRRGESQAGLAVAEQAVEFYRRTLGVHHLDYASGLGILSRLYFDVGRWRESVELLDQAFAIELAALGDRHPRLASTLIHRAYLCGGEGRFRDALQALNQAERIHDWLIGQVLPGISENRALAWLEDIRALTEVYLSLVLKAFLDEREAVEAACHLLLRRKALVFEVLYQRSQVQRGAALPERQRQVLRELAAQRARLAELALSIPDPNEAAGRRQKMAAISVKIEELEEAMARHQDRPTISRLPGGELLERAVSILGKNAALIEFVRFSRFDFRPKDPSRPWGPARYLAFILRPSAPVRVKAIDLGPSAFIDAQFERFQACLSRRSMEQEPAAANRAGAEVYQSLFAPLEADLQGCEHLYVALDGGLNGLSFEAIPAGSGYLLDRFRISYLTSGRELVHLAERRLRDPVTRDLVVAACPDFDLADPSAPPAPPGRLKPMQGMLDEARAVGEVLGTDKVTLLVGREVTKGRIQAISSPRLLHLVTHGFYLERVEPPSRQEGVRGLDDHCRGGPLNLLTAPPENPLYRSAIALAGANAGLSGRPLPAEAGNGLLLASEVLELDLRGTELVVLSACETALGENRDREGTYGLRRSFLLAGAQTLIAALWKVPDRETKELMTELYRQLQKGCGRGEALRRAQKSLRARELHPFLWAAFVCIGDPDFSPAENPDRPPFVS